jgi:transposase
VLQLLARIAKLEAKLVQPPNTPTNSLLPPSRGQKANVAAQPQEKKKGRKGWPGVARALCPNPDASREVYADKCACGARLEPADQSDVFAYDHIDLPPIRPVTTASTCTRPLPSLQAARHAGGMLPA